MPTLSGVLDVLIETQVIDAADVAQITTFPAPKKPSISPQKVLSC